MSLHQKRFSNEFGVRYQMYRVLVYMMKKRTVGTSKRTICTAADENAVAEGRAM